ncbi:MAG TPA: ABC transporter permease [Streptosporangiaceae bacterium]|jgi:ABC-type dipeptide/oligopeptide/nickel transport system permease subunit
MSSGPHTETAEAAATATAGGAVGGRRASLWGDAWLELRRRPVFWLAAVMLAFMVLLACVPSLFTSLGPNRGCVLAHSKDGTGPGHPFGFDTQGCDLWSQVIHGARPTILIGLAVTVGSLVISIIFGTLAGYYGGLLDALIARVTDIFFGLPFVLGATVILVAFPDHGVGAMCLVLVVLGWTTMTRIMRSQVISVKTMDYVRAARALGAGDLRIMFRHILPNAIAPVFVVSMLNVGQVIAYEATLDYLGVGLQYPTVSWGLQLNVAQDYFTDFPHLLVFPAVFLSVTVLSFIMLGDVLRDALDPRLR